MSLQIEIPQADSQGPYSDSNSIVEQRKKKISKKALLQSLKKQVEDAWQKFQELEEGHHVDTKAYNKLMNKVEDLENRTSTKLERCSLIRQESLQKPQGRSYSLRDSHRRESPYKKSDLKPILRVSEQHEENSTIANPKNLKKSLYVEYSSKIHNSEKQKNNPYKRMTQSAVIEPSPRRIKIVSNRPETKMHRKETMVNFTVAFCLGVALILILKFWFDSV